MVCSFSPDGTHIVAGASDCSIYIWSWDATPVTPSTTEGPHAAEESFQQLPAASSEASGGDVPGWCSEGAGAPKELCRLEGHKHDVVLLRFSPDGSGFATGSKDGTVRVSLLGLPFVTREIFRPSSTAVGALLGDFGCFWVGFSGYKRLLG